MMDCATFFFNAPILRLESDGRVTTMNSTSATLTAKAPSYAPDGSQGYFLTVTRERRRATGWIPAWIAEHTAAVLRPF